MVEYTTPEMENVVEENKDLLEKWLTFWLDGQLYGSAIVHIEQIVSMLPITEVPEYPPYAKGVINIRGAIIPLIDLRLRIGKPEAAYTDQTCIIICRIDDSQIGFIADSVDAVMTILPEQISSPPKMGEDGSARYLRGIARIASDDGEKLVLCLDTTKVLLDNEVDLLVQNT